MKGPETTFKLYKVTCYGSYMMDEQGTCFSLEPWGCDSSYYQGFDDGGKEYVFPEGCDIVRFEDGEAFIRWNGNQADIVDDHGKPTLVSIEGMTTLKEA